MRITKWRIFWGIILLAFIVGVASQCVSPENPPEAPPPVAAAIQQPTPAAQCTSATYNRKAWGDYPRQRSSATPRWTKAGDGVAATAITADHHVALKDAHLSGGCHWTAQQRNRFAADPTNLNPTTQSFNSSKGSRTPDALTGIAKRIIDTRPERCAYAWQHEAIKTKYGLTMTASERATVDRWLALC